MLSDQRFETLKLEERGNVLTVLLNRPDALNAMNPTMVGELLALFEGLDGEASIRVVILRGEGRHFCAGLDLKRAHEDEAVTSIVAQLDRQRRFARIYTAMRRCPQPIIAVVQGAASGGGMALALASDLRLLTPDARMNAAFIRLGLTACDMGVSYFLPRLVGPTVASELMLTGRFIDAARAERLGLSNGTYPVDEIVEIAQAFAADMLRATPLALRLTKDALNQSIDAAGLDAVMAIEDRNQMLALQDEHFEEGISAFLEKRTPVYD